MKNFHALSNYQFDTLLDTLLLDNKKIDSMIYINNNHSKKEINNAVINNTAKKSIHHIVGDNNTETITLYLLTREIISINVGNVCYKRAKTISRFK